MTKSDKTAQRFNLQRFIEARHPLYATALGELKAGRKRTHWMWFIFPQVEGLGHSSMAQHYAIKSRDEAIGYLATPLLRALLIECTRAVLAVPAKTAFEMFGSPDDMKFRSSMTLFDAVDDGGRISFRQVSLSTDRRALTIEDDDRKFAAALAGAGATLDTAALRDPFLLGAEFKAASQGSQRT